MSFKPCQVPAVSEDSARQFLDGSSLAELLRSLMVKEFLRHPGSMLMVLSHIWGASPSTFRSAWRTFLRTLAAPDTDHWWHNLRHDHARHLWHLLFRLDAGRGDIFPLLQSRLSRENRPEVLESIVLNLASSPFCPEIIGQLWQLCKEKTEAGLAPTRQAAWKAMAFLSGKSADPATCARAWLECLYSRMQSETEISVLDTMTDTLEHLPPVTTENCSLYQQWITLLHHQYLTSVDTCSSHLNSKQKELVWKVLARLLLHFRPTLSQSTVLPSPVTLLRRYLPWEKDSRVLAAMAEVIPPLPKECQPWIKIWLANLPQKDSAWRLVFWQAVSAISKTGAPLSAAVEKQLLVHLRNENEPEILLAAARWQPASPEVGPEWVNFWRSVLGTVKKDLKVNIWKTLMTGPGCHSPASSWVTVLLSECVPYEKDVLALDLLSTWPPHGHPMPETLVKAWNSRWQSSETWRRALTVTALSKRQWGTHATDWPDWCADWIRSEQSPEVLWLLQRFSALFRPPRESLTTAWLERHREDNNPATRVIARVALLGHPSVAMDDIIEILSAGKPNDAIMAIARWCPAGTPLPPAFWEAWKHCLAPSDNQRGNFHFMTAPLNTLYNTLLNWQPTQAREVSAMWNFWKYLLEWRDQQGQIPVWHWAAHQGAECLQTVPAFFPPPADLPRQTKPSAEYISTFIQVATSHSTGTLPSDETWWQRHVELHLLFLAYSDRYTDPQRTAVQNIQWMARHFPGQTFFSPIAWELFQIALPQLDHPGLALGLLPVGWQYAPSNRNCHWHQFIFEHSAGNDQEKALFQFTAYHCLLEALANCLDSHSPAGDITTLIRHIRLLSHGLPSQAVDTLLTPVKKMLRGALSVCYPDTFSVPDDILSWDSLQNTVKNGFSPQTVPEKKDIIPPEIRSSCSDQSQTFTPLLSRP